MEKQWVVKKWLSGSYVELHRCKTADEAHRLAQQYMSPGVTVIVESQTKT